MKEPRQQPLLFQFSSAPTLIYFNTDQLVSTLTYKTLTNTVGPQKDAEQQVERELRTKRG